MNLLYFLNIVLNSPYASIPSLKRPAYIESKIETVV